MGVLSVLRNIDEIAAEVGKNDPVAVISCNNCVKACGTGGEMHLSRIAGELKKRGVRVEEEILVTNPCSRGYLENYDLSKAVKTAVALTCVGTQAAFKTLHPQVRIVAGVETVGLFVNSKAKGRLKAVAVFPGYEMYKNKEFKLGDTSEVFEDEALPLAGGEEAAS